MGGIQKRIILRKSSTSKSKRRDQRRNRENKEKEIIQVFSSLPSSIFQTE